MDRQQFYRDRLAEHLDGNGDLAPPWEQFPNYERYTIGWRMGAGEDYLSYWHVFLDTLAPAFEVRLAYLRRHPPAPVNWADHVYAVLYPSSRDSDSEEDEEGEAERRAELFRYGLIASDIAYSIWLRQQQGVRWIWEDAEETPETVARYWTRDFWFWSRQITELRATAGWIPPTVHERWAACKEPLENGVVPSPDLKRGLLTLAQMLTAGRVITPWEFGLGTNTFADSFEMDMGYADAFRLWGMSAFDDREQMQCLLGDPANIPESWRGWVAKHFYFD
jgi:hypothetical protein